MTVPGLGAGVSALTVAVGITAVTEAIVMKASPQAFVNNAITNPLIDRLNLSAGIFSEITTQKRFQHNPIRLGTIKQEVTTSDIPPRRNFPTLFMLRSRACRVMRMSAFHPDEEVGNRIRSNYDDDEYFSGYRMRRRCWLGWLEYNLGPAFVACVEVFERVWRLCKR